jgi:hypothetical protein
VQEIRYRTIPHSWAFRPFYQARRPANAAPAKPRGPKPPVDDTNLLAAIRADLAASPFSGEGHRKVWARLHSRTGPAATRTTYEQPSCRQLALSILARCFFGLLLVTGGATATSGS